jgi:phytanoyl-CoA hydroxylase
MHFTSADLDSIERQYETDGFVKIQPFFDDAGMKEIERELARYTEDVVPNLPAGDVIWEPEPLADGRRAIRNLFRLDKHSRFFSELGQDAGLLNLMNRLLHGEAEVTGVETFSKPAYVGSVVPYHQDNAYFNLVPPDSLTCWIALDDSTLENGCVQYARGSHRELRPHKRSGVKGNSLMMAEPPAPGEFEEVAGVLPRGGAILHHCVLMHRSEPNRSARSRRGLLIVYRGRHCKTDPLGEQAYRAVLATVD